MTKYYCLSSDQRYTLLQISSAAAEQLFQRSSLRRYDKLFPLSAKSVMLGGEASSREIIGGAIEGLRGMLCVDEHAVSVIREVDAEAFFGEINVEHSDQRRYLYVPSSIVGPSNAFEDMSLTVAGRFRLRSHNFEGLPPSVEIFTLPEGFEGAGDTWCTQRFLERIVCGKLCGFVAWDPIEREEFVPYPIRKSRNPRKAR